MMDSTAKLIRRVTKKDAIGQNVTAEEKSGEIFIEVSSVSRAEFFAAGKTGLAPEFVFKTAAVNYSGESEIEYGGKRYAIYRTYSPPESDSIELYVQAKAGVVK